jgi:hypothetical protein
MKMETKGTDACMGDSNTGSVRLLLLFSGGFDCTLSNIHLQGLLYPLLCR